MDNADRIDCGELRAPEADPAGGPTPALLDFLIAHYPALFSIEELVQLFSSPGQDQARERVEIEEGVDQLIADGLSHVLGGFVWASHAAVSSERRLRA
jgi:hypothetical protein